MNPRYFKKLIYLLRYGFISPIWSYIAPIIIKVSGPRAAAYLSYKSIDWGEMNHEKTILHLQRESFVKDIIELRKRSNYNYPMIAGGFKRFQMVWFPIEMQIQIFYKLHQKKNNKALTSAVESFNPNVFVDITDYIGIKKQVLEAYSKELRQPPHSRSIDNTLRLNALRGNSVSVEYAEAFELLRMSR